MKKSRPCCLEKLGEETATHDDTWLQSPKVSNCKKFKSQLRRGYHRLDSGRALQYLVTIPVTCGQRTTRLKTTPFAKQVMSAGTGSSDRATSLATPSARKWYVTLWHPRNMGWNIWSQVGVQPASGSKRSGGGGSPFDSFFCLLLLFSSKPAVSALQTILEPSWMCIPIHKRFISPMLALTKFSWVLWAFQTSWLGPSRHTLILLILPGRWRKHMVLDHHGHPAITNGIPQLTGRRNLFLWMGGMTITPLHVSPIFWFQSVIHPMTFHHHIPWNHHFQWLNISNISQNYSSTPLSFPAIPSANRTWQYKIHHW